MKKAKEAILDLNAYKLVKKGTENESQIIWNEIIFVHY